MKTRSLQNISPRKAKEFSETSCPWLVLPKKICTLLRKTLSKKRSTAFNDAWLKILEQSEKVTALRRKRTAINPLMIKKQKDGKIELQLHAEIAALEEAWKEMFKHC